MAKYQITRACGHQDTVNICGPHKDRDWKVDRERERDCLECYRWKRAEEAEGAAANSRLPELLGSEKQVAWAKTIRHEVLFKTMQLPGGKSGNALYLLAAIDDHLATEGPDEKVQVQRDAIAAVINEPSAKWWIDNRGAGFRTLARNRISG